jgi:NitT/TauT family transport system substrate-binding protein
MGNKSGKYLLIVVVCLFMCALFVDTGPVKAEKWPTVRMAFGDIPAMDTIALQAAVKRLNERGVPIKSNYFKSDQLSNQAVVSKQVDLGSGTPYGIIQKMNQTGKGKLRCFFQRQVLQYMPVVRKSKYKSWKDLDGQEIVVHARASGTEAQAKTGAKQYGIKFSKIKYVPGTEVRGNAMLKGTIDASVIGIFTTNMLMEKQPGQWLVLPLEGVSATDDALYGRMEWLVENEAVVKEIIKEILLMYRRIQADPSYANELRDQYKLMPDLPPEIVKQIPSYYKISAERGLYSVNGGGMQAAKTDLEFFHIAGQLKGEVKDLKVEDFWYLKPLNDVLDEIGRIKIEY